MATPPVNNTNNSITNNSNSGVNSGVNPNLIEEWANIQFPLPFQLLVTISGIFAIFVNSRTMVAMANTTRILYANRLMSIGLSMFDIKYAISAIAFVWSYGVTSRGVVFSVNILWVGLCYLTVCMMSLERYIALRYPYTYIKWVASETKIGRIILSTWGTLVVLYLQNYYGMCSLFGQWPVSVELCTVNNIVNGVFIVVLTVISIYCNIRVYTIFAAEAKKSQITTNMRGVFKHSRTNMATVILFSSNLFTYAMVFVVTICSSLYLLSTLTLYTLMVAIHLLNSFSDPLIYALWYKECRYKLYSMLAFCSDSFREKSDAMKLQVYGIITMKRRVNEQPSASMTMLVQEGAT